MEKPVAIVTLVIFSLLALVLVTGGLFVIFTGDGTRQEVASTGTASAHAEILPPPIPDLPPLTDTALATYQVSAYQHQISGYTQRVAAYDKYLQALASKRAKGPDRLARYQGVVKEALLPILNPLVMAFIAYAFVKGTTNVVRNIMAARNSAAMMTDLKLF